SSHAPHSLPPSFPTRRSSDLPCSQNRDQVCSLRRDVTTWRVDEIELLERRRLRGCDLGPSSASTLNTCPGPEKEKPRWGRTGASVRRRVVPILASEPEASLNAARFSAKTGAAALESPAPWLRCGFVPYRRPLRFQLIEQGRPGLAQLIVELQQQHQYHCHLV